MVNDADGEPLSVVVTEDEHGMLFELQLVRYAHGNVIAPDWTTLRALDSDQIIDLGTST